jgi:hypothetical protein
MSKQTVWASNVMINPAMLRPMTHSFNADAQSRFVSDIRRRNDGGEPLGPECFPPEVFVAKGAKNNYESLPNIFFAGSYWIVSEAVAAVMRQFDLGNTNLYPVSVFRKDRQTPIGDTWFCLNFGNAKRAFLGEQSTGAQKFGSGTTDRWNAPTILKDGQLAMTADALAGPDIWVDPRIFDLFFVSDRLAKALKHAGLASAFGFKKCKVA